MLILNNNEIQELLNIIEAHHLFFIGKKVSSDLLTKEDKALLKSFGIETKLFTEDIGSLNTAYKFGVLAAALGDAETAKLSFQEFRNYILRGQYIPLTRPEEKALERIKFQAYHDIKGLSDRIGKDLILKNQGIGLTGTKRYQKFIEEKAEEAILKRQGTRELAGVLARETGDWGRDFTRIADFIMHSAYEQGRAEFYKEKYQGDIPVYKDVFQGACSSCVKLYLTAGVGSVPKIFTLKELEANGNNIGRRQKEWLPVIGPTHPYCRCQLANVPEDREWDPETKGFTKLKVWKRKVPVKSKIKVTIGNKEYEV